jgi:hypothetical protein
LILLHFGFIYFVGLNLVLLHPIIVGTDVILNKLINYISLKKCALQFAYYYLYISE